MEDKLKTYKMLKTTQGSPDGFTIKMYNKGETYDDIAPELAEQFYHQGAIEEVTGKKNPADTRETKVGGPTETKVSGPSAYKGEAGEAGIDPNTQRIEELNATARDHYGLDTDTKMKPQAIRDALKDASEGKDTDLPESVAEPLTTENAKTKKPRK